MKPAVNSNVNLILPEAVGGWPNANCNMGKPTVSRYLTRPASTMQAH